MHFLNTMMFALLAIFPIMNPPAMAPMFLELTASASPGERRHLALLISLYSFILLTVLLFVGGWILGIMGISVPVIGIAGGLLLFHTAWRMLNKEERINESERRDLQERVMDKAFFPLTMPVTAGPGTMAITLTLVPQGTIMNPAVMTDYLAVTCGIIVASASVYFFYRYAEAFMRKLGRTGSAAMTQISAFILLAIGVQIIWNGVRGLIISL